MSITINSNILSLNAQRRLGQHTNDLRSSFEKLSSGLRVSKASDDAAGLSISENLKIDTKLSSQALRNVNDGISMISIISGALDSQKSILFRMAELAEQSANGVNSSKQRGALQKEYMSLQEEFDRVASSAKFNGISLLRNPDPKTISLMAGITGADTSLLSVAAANSHRFQGEYQMASDLPGSNPDIVDIDEYFEFLSQIGKNPWEYTSAIRSDFYHYANKGAEFTITGDQGTDITVRLGFFQYTAFPRLASIWGAIETSDSTNFESGMDTLIDGNSTTYIGSGSLSGSGETFSFELDLSGISYSDNYSGAQAFTYVKSNTDARPSAIGFTNINSQKNATSALVTVKNRIEDLSKLQGSFGAIESRLSFAANKLQVDRENFQSATSQITDVDVATESSNLTKTQILQQAAVSVLAQANQQPQIALQLLGGLR